MALKHLIDVRIEHITGDDADSKQKNLGYKIIFEFSPNDFFENKVLEKAYFYEEEVDYTGEFVYDHATGTSIQWKEDKDLTKEFEIKKQRNKSAFPHIFFPTQLSLTFYFISVRYQAHSACS